MRITSSCYALCVREHLSCFAPLVRTLFFAARTFRPRKNVSLAPRVPMSTFSKPSEPMRPRNCRRHPVGWGGVVGCTASRTRVPAALVSAQQRLTLANHRAPRCPPRAHSSSKASRRSESRAAGANRRDGVRELVRVVRDHRRRRRGHGEREARHWQWRRRRSTWRRPVKVKLCVCARTQIARRARGRVILAGAGPRCQPRWDALRQVHARRHSTRSRER